VIQYYHQLSLANNLHTGGCFATTTTYY